MDATRARMHRPFRIIATLLLALSGGMLCATQHAWPDTRTTRPESSWLLEREGDLYKESQFTEAMTERLNRVLRENAAVPEVALLRTQFEGHLLPSLFINVGGGASKFVTKDEAVTKKASDPRTLEVVFFGQSAVNHPRVRGRLFFYSPEWRAVFVPALRYPDDIWFDAFFLHELWHAHQDRERKKNRTGPLPLSSAPRAEAELQAIDVQEKVLAWRTRGAYAKDVKRIAERISANSLDEFLSKVKTEHLEEIGARFAPPLSEERHLRYSQYGLGLARRWLRKAYAGETLRNAEIAMYLRMAKQQ